MKIILFDVGAYKGEITDRFINLFSELGVDYEVIQFEPAKDSFAFLQKKYISNDKVRVKKVALGADDNKEVKLYHTPNADGYSLHKSKWNITSENDFEMVDCMKLSTILKSRDKESLVILKVNIEGSEYELYEDLIKTGMNNAVDLYCGSLGDLYKLKDKTKEDGDKFKKYLENNNINVIEYVPGRVDNLPAIKQKIVDWQKTVGSPEVFVEIITVKDDKVVKPKRERKLKKEIGKVKEIER